MSTLSLVCSGPASGITIRCFEVMVRRAGLNPDRSHTHGQDTIGAEQCISALEEYARIFGEAVRAGFSYSVCDPVTRRVCSPSMR